MAKSKYVYFFGGGSAEGNGTMREVLGGKGAGLAEMTAIGLPVPAGFTITTEVCEEYYKNNRKYPVELKAQVESYLSKLEKLPEKTWGQKRSSFGFRSIRGSRFDARNDGDNFEFRLK
ncbi:hypothetical protein HMPREF9353_01609 [Treponema denticola F0402]|nr:hypothetical protein HMPREF9353_01609 [Treponema denticola F0402]